MKYSGEAKYKQFTELLVTAQYEIVGVRIPALRVMAKQMLKDKSWEKQLVTDPQYHEDVFIQGKRPFVGVLN